jgi:preprotein translocase subunit SecE
VAKAVRTAQSSRQPAKPAAARRPARPQPGMATAGADRRQSMREYLRGVGEELRKVVWPARDELLRMTGIVVATVLLFGALIGGADYILSLGVRQVYTGNSSSTASATLAPTTTTTAPAVQTSSAATSPASPLP